MKVAVTGASGHIGTNLTAALKARGDEVAALVFPGTSLADGEAVRQISGNVLEPATLHEAFAGAEVVYHLASVITLKSSRDDEAHRVNVEGTQNVVAACREAGVRRLVHFSSIHALSAFPLDAVVDEDRSLADGPSELPYDRSKAEAERIVLEAVRDGLDAVVLNPTGVLGPWDYEPSHMGRVLISMCRGHMPALVDGGFNWVDVRDVCQGAVAAAQLGRKGERYILSGRHASFRALAQHVAEFTGATRFRLSVPVGVAWCCLPFATLGSKLTGRQPRLTAVALHSMRRHQNVSSDKAVRELEYRCRPTRDTVGDTVTWFRGQGWIG